MGTRALISKNEKPFIATHWDGYPSSLGKDLMNATSDSEVIKIASRHSINAAAGSIRKTCEEAMRKIHKADKKYNYGTDTQGNFVTDIGNYGDWAEFQYDLSGGRWRFRSLSGEFPDSLKSAGAWKPLTPENAKD